jgi:hypothetical protein
VDADDNASVSVIGCWFSDGAPSGDWIIFATNVITGTGFFTLEIDVDKGIADCSFPLANVSTPVQIETEPTTDFTDSPAFQRSVPLLTAEAASSVDTSVQFNLSCSFSSTEAQIQTSQLTRTSQMSLSSFLGATVSGAVCAILPRSRRFVHSVADRPFISRWRNFGSLLSVRSH